MGLEHINKSAKILWAHMFGRSSPKLLPSRGAYTVINGYVYFSCVYNPLLIMIKSLSPRSLREGMMNSVPRYEAAQKVFVAEVNCFEEIQLGTLPAGDLLDSAESLFHAACIYFRNIQRCLPSAMISETFFRKFFHKTAKRNGISDMSVFLLGFDTVSLKAEKSLYQNVEWAKQNLELAAYINQTPAKRINEDFALPKPPSNISSAIWQEWSGFISVIVVLCLFALTIALTAPTLNASLSKVAETNKGALMGVASTVRSLSKVVGPLLFGYLYEINIELPYIGGAMVAMVGVTICMAWKKAKEPMY